jgi:hypothetical protein
VTNRRRRSCFNCGEDLGEIEWWPGDMPTCGKRECEREARAQEQADRENRALDASNDDYSRYG